MKMACLAALCGALLSGCASYTVPGGPANFKSLGVTPEARRAMTDPAVQLAIDKKPLAEFPATIAVAHVQAQDYATYDRWSHQTAWRGAYSVITTRSIEKDEDFETLTRLPQVNAVVALKRILLDHDANSDAELRTAAAKLHADMLLFYTFDTEFYTDTKVAPLGVITLGIFPNKSAHVTCTASAVLMDVHNGYLYSVVEATSQDHQLANAWTSGEAMDEVRKRVERDAFEQLLKQFRQEWPVVVATYNRPGRPPAER